VKKIILNQCLFLLSVFFISMQAQDARSCEVTVCCNEQSEPSETGCSVTAIVNTGAMQILTESGSYCLAQDLFAPISIQGSNIDLDLNGHRIFLMGIINTAGVIIDGGVSNVRVRNGLIVGAQQINTACIVIGYADSTRIEDVTWCYFIRTCCSR
jgi:hypothetical protein